MVRQLGDFAAAEDAVQEDLLAAAMQWPEDGLPDNPPRLADLGRLPPHDRSLASRARAPKCREAAFTSRADADTLPGPSPKMAPTFRFSLGRQKSRPT